MKAKQSKSFQTPSHKKKQSHTDNIISIENLLLNPKNNKSISNITNITNNKHNPRTLSLDLSNLNHPGKKENFLRKENSEKNGENQNLKSDQNIQNSNSNPNTNFTKSLLLNSQSHTNKFCLNPALSSLNKNFLSQSRLAKENFRTNSSVLYNLTEINQSIQSGPPTENLNRYGILTTNCNINVSDGINLKSTQKEEKNNSGKNILLCSSTLTKYLKGNLVNTNFSQIQKPKNESRNLSKSNFLTNSFLVTQVNKNSSKNVTSENLIENPSPNINSIVQGNVNNIYFPANQKLNLNYKNKKIENEKVSVKKNFEANSNLSNLINLYNKKNERIKKSLNKTTNVSQEKSKSKSKLQSNLNSNKTENTNLNLMKKGIARTQIHIQKHSSKSKEVEDSNVNDRHTEIETNSNTQLLNNFQKNFLTNTNEKNFTQSIENIQNETENFNSSQNYSNLKIETKIKLKNLKDSIYEILNFDSKEKNRIQIMRELESIYKEVLINYNSLSYHNMVDNLTTNNLLTNPDSNNDERRKSNDLKYENLIRENESLKIKIELIDKKLDLVLEENSKLRKYLQEKTENMEDMKTILNHYKTKIEELHKNQINIQTVEISTQDRETETKKNLEKSDIKNSLNYKKSFEENSIDHKIDKKIIPKLDLQNLKLEKNLLKEKNSEISENSQNSKIVHKESSQTIEIKYNINNRNNTNPYYNIIEQKDIDDRENLESAEISLDDQKILYYETKNEEKKIPLLRNPKLNDTAINFPKGILQNKNIRKSSYKEDDEVGKEKLLIILNSNSNLIKENKTNTKTNSNSLRDNLNSNSNLLKNFKENFNQHETRDNEKSPQKTRHTTIHKTPILISPFPYENEESSDNDISAKINRVKTGCFAEESNTRSNNKNDTADNSKENKIGSATTANRDNYLGLNLDKIKHSNFQDEFLENLEEFSISWRKEVEKMNQRYSNK